MLIVITKIALGTDDTLPAFMVQGFFCIYFPKIKQLNAD